eukprot:g14144.t1
MGACQGKPKEDEPVTKYVYYSPRPGKEGGWYDANGTEMVETPRGADGMRIPRPGQGSALRGNSPRGGSPGSPRGGSPGSPRGGAPGSPRSGAPGSGGGGKMSPRAGGQSPRAGEALKAAGTMLNKGNAKGG